MCLRSRISSFVLGLVEGDFGVNHHCKLKLSLFDGLILLLASKEVFLIYNFNCYVIWIKSKEYISWLNLLIKISQRVSFKGRIESWYYPCFPRPYFCFYYSSIFSRGKITLWMKRLRSLLATVSPCFYFFFYYFELRKIF